MLHSLNISFFFSNCVSINDVKKRIFLNMIFVSV